MKTLSILTKSLCCLVLFSGTASADIAINIDPGRENPNAPDATIDDFISQNPDSGLTASSTFLNSVGNAGGSLFGLNFTSPGMTVGDFVVTAGRNDGVVGSGIELAVDPETGETGEPLNASDSGFNAGAGTINDLNPITEGYVFNAVNHFVSIDGLLANSNEGDTIILSTWGIGDNVSQNSDFTVTYGDVMATQSTFYNDGGARDDATGSVPFVNFTFTADGVTDQIRFDIISSGHLNAFSLAIIPGGVTPDPVGDFNGDNVVDCTDLDGYIGNIGTSVAGITGGLANLDFDGDGTITMDDANSTIADLVVTSNGVTGTFPGDVNCDGTVNVLGDALALVTNLGGSATMYSQGDVNFDGTVNVLGDALILVTNLGMSNTP